MAFSVIPARSEHDLDMVRTLFREYVTWLGIDLAIRGLESELQYFPGEYAPPTGDLLLAHSNSSNNSEALGCVGLHPLAMSGACEVKRLYVREAARGIGVGYALASAILDVAASLGYREIMLDTLPWMTSAITIYRALGFRRIPPYWDNKVPGIIYFGKKLDAAG